MRLMELTKLELSKLLMNKRNLWTSIIIVLFWTILVIPGALTVQEGLMDYLTNSVFFMATAVGMFICFIYSGTLFLNEKQQKTIETLLSSPLTLKEIWLSKTFAATVPAVLASWLCALIIFSVASIARGLVVPTLELLVYLLILAPTILLSVIGILGYLQFLLGMKENRLISMLLFVGLFAALGMMDTVASQENVVKWTTIAGLIMGATLLLVLTLYCTRFLDKERIITTLD